MKDNIGKIGRTSIPKDLICQNKVPEKYSLRYNIYEFILFARLLVQIWFSYCREVEYLWKIMDEEPLFVEF